MFFNEKEELPAALQALLSAANMIIARCTMLLLMPFQG